MAESDGLVYPDMEEEARQKKADLEGDQYVAESEKFSAIEMGRRFLETMKGKTKQTASEPIVPPGKILVTINGEQYLEENDGDPYREYAGISSKNK